MRSRCSRGGLWGPLSEVGLIVEAQRKLGDTTRADGTIRRARQLAMSYDQIELMQFLASVGQIDEARRILLDIVKKEEKARLDQRQPPGTPISYRYFIYRYVE